MIRRTTDRLGCKLWEGGVDGGFHSSRHNFAQLLFSMAASHNIVELIKAIPFTSYFSTYPDFIHEAFVRHHECFSLTAPIPKSCVKKLDLPPPWSIN